MGHGGLLEDLRGYPPQGPQEVLLPPVPQRGQLFLRPFGFRLGPAQTGNFAFMNRFTDNLRLPSEDEAVKTYQEVYGEGTYKTDWKKP